MVTELLLQGSVWLHSDSSIRGCLACHRSSAQERVPNFLKGRHLASQSQTFLSQPLGCPPTSLICSYCIFLRRHRVPTEPHVHPRIHSKSSDGLHSYLIKCLEILHFNSYNAWLRERGWDLTSDLSANNVKGKHVERFM